MPKPQLTSFGILCGIPLYFDVSCSIARVWITFWMVIFLLLSWIQTFRNESFLYYCKTVYENISVKFLLKYYWNTILSSFNSQWDFVLRYDLPYMFLKRLNIVDNVDSSILWGFKTNSLRKIKRVNISMNQWGDCWIREWLLYPLGNNHIPYSKEIFNSISKSHELYAHFLHSCQFLNVYVQVVSQSEIVDDCRSAGFDLVGEVLKRFTNRFSNR